MNKSCCLLKFFIELYFLSWLFIKISFLSLCWLFSVVNEHDMQYFISKIKMKMNFSDLLLQGVFEFLNKYLFYYCEAYIYYQVLFIQAFNNSQCTWHLFCGQKSEVAGWKGDFGNWITKIFLKVSAQSHYYPAYYTGIDWPDWTVLSNSWILHIKMFNVVFIFMSCCARVREARASIALNWISAIWSCKIILWKNSRII